VVITLEVGNTQLRKYEEYAFVLDFKSRSKSTTVRGRTGSIVIAIGEERLTLLEILGNENTIFEVGERVYIGKEGRSKVQSVLGKITYEKISVSAQNEIPAVIQLIVTKNEKRFIDYLNNAQPLTPRVHSLELIPGIGKTYLSVLIQERERKPFESYDDIVRRTHLKEPIIHLTKRILEEISGETRMNIFVKR
jgi:putative nucleotide binding protein